MSFGASLRKGLFSIVGAATKSPPQQAVAPPACEQRDAERESDAPFAEAQRTPRKHAASGRIPRLRSARILVIDDDAQVAAALKRLLRHHDVSVALTGSEALEAIRRESFEVIVSDVMMPRPSGVDTYRALLAEGSPLVHRFVFVTGGGHDADARRFLREVPNLCLEKPVESEALELAIFAILRGEDPRSSSSTG